MLAEQASSIGFRLPQELRERAYAFGNEMAWTAPDAAEAVSWLAGERCAVIGIELWREQEGRPLWVATSDYSPSIHDTISPEEVSHCARKAGEFIQAHRREPGALFNLTWLEPSRAEQALTEPAFT